MLRAVENTVPEWAAFAAYREVEDYESLKRVVFNFKIGIKCFRADCTSRSLSTSLPSTLIEIRSSMDPIVLPKLLSLPNGRVHNCEENKQAYRSVCERFLARQEGYHDINSCSSPLC